MRLFLIYLLALSTFSSGHAETPYLHAPSVNTQAKHNPSGTTILPDGRLITPAGLCVPVSKWPTGVAISPDSLKVFVSSDSIGQFIWNYAAKTPAIIPFAPCAQPQEDVHDTAGDPVFSPDGSELYWSSGDLGGVYVVDVRLRTMLVNIPVNGVLNGRIYEDSFVVDVKVSPDGQYLYGADIANFRVVVIDLKQHKMIGSVDVGRYPYALAVSGSRVFVRRSQRGSERRRRGRRTECSRPGRSKCLGSIFGLGD